MLSLQNAVMWVLVGFAVTVVILAKAPHKSDKKLTFSRLWDLCYDAFICMISLVDIACDMLITYHFYLQQRMTFFWISVVIFAMAQISYALALTISLEPLQRPPTGREVVFQRIKMFLLFFPFGQLIPVFLMVQDANVQWFDRLYRRFGFRTIFSDIHNNFSSESQRLRQQREARRRQRLDRIAAHTGRRDGLLSRLHGQEEEESDSEDDIPDELSDYIKRKAVSHLGFVIESVVEAVPQSILQMVFIVVHGNYTWLNVFSIFMSMSVVASKGTLLSYCVYRPAAVFGFLCFCVDIFGIFAVCSWLFCIPDDLTIDTANYVFLGTFPMWGPAYYYFTLLKFIFYILLVAALLGLLLLIHAVYNINPDRPWRSVWFVLMMVGGAMLLAMPASLVVLSVRFTLIPVLVLQSINHNRHVAAAFFRALFAFMSEAPTIGDLHRRILIANWRLACFAQHQDHRLVPNWRKPAATAVARLEGHELRLSTMFRLMRWNTLSTLHEVREAVMFIWSLDIWRLGDELQNDYKRQRLGSIWEQVKTIIGWQDLRSGIRDGWTDFKNQPWKEHIRRFFQTLKNRARDRWRYRYWPFLRDRVFSREVWAPILWESIRETLFGVIQDAYNLWRIPRLALRRLRGQNPGKLPRLALVTVRVPQEWFVDGLMLNVSGLWVAGTHIVYHYVHIPLRDFWNDRWWTDTFYVFPVVLLLAGVLPLLLVLALYSLFLPTVFLAASLWYEGGVFVHPLQAVLTIAHGVLLLGMFALVPWVWRFCYADFHLYPFFAARQVIPVAWSKHVANVYYDTPRRDDILRELFGDVSAVVTEYLPRFHVRSGDENEKDDKDDVSSDVQSGSPKMPQRRGRRRRRRRRRGAKEETQLQPQQVTQEAYGRGKVD